MAQEWQTGAAGVARVISEMDRPTVFGLPGGHMTQVIDQLRDMQDRVDCVLVREESIGTVMAEAHGRLSGTPAVVIGQGAWVLGDAGIGIMEAKMGASPMVVLVDATEGGSFSHHGPYQAGMADFGGYRLADALRAMTKQTFIALDPFQAVQMTQLAVKHATTGAPGPVAVVFHSNSLTPAAADATGPSLWDSRGYWTHQRPAPDPKAVTELARIVRAAKRPVVIAGNGIRVGQAQPQLQAFVERFDIPVVTTPGGKGALSERHQLSGGIMGTFGNAKANTVVGEADLLIAVGTKLSPTDTANGNPRLVDPSRQTVVHIDVDPLSMGWTTSTELAIVSDAAAALEALTEELGDYRGAGAERLSALAAGDSEDWKQRLGFGGRAAVAVLNAVLPENTVVTSDAGENRLFILHDYKPGQGGTVMQPNGGGGMGYAIPAAMAASRLSDGRPAVAVCGDGGASMSLHALMTAVENQLKLVVVVLDNNALGWVLHGQGERPFMSEFAHFDFAAIARAIGCEAESADNPEGFAEALQRALDRESGVSVVVANITQQDTYLDIMSDLTSYDPETVRRDN